MQQEPTWPRVLAYSHAEASYICGPVEMLSGYPSGPDGLWTEWMCEPPLTGNGYWEDFTFAGEEVQLEAHLRELDRVLELDLELAPDELVKVGLEFLFGEGDDRPNRWGFSDPGEIAWSILAALGSGSTRALTLTSYVALAVLVRELDTERSRTARQERRHFRGLTVPKFIVALASRGLELTLTTTRPEAEQTSDSYPPALADADGLPAALIAAAQESEANSDMLKTRNGLDTKYLDRVRDKPGEVRVVDLFGRMFMTNRRFAIRSVATDVTAPSGPWSALWALHSTIGK